MVWQNMIAMSVKGRAILGHKFISGIGEMLNTFIRSKSEWFEFFGEFNRFKVGEYNKGDKWNLS